jgi:uncharacterized protein
MVFLDANPVIYLIEQPANLGSKVTARVSDLLASGERLAVSDLVRMECQVGPLKANDAELLARYATFFSSPDLDVLPGSPAVCDRAARIRALRVQTSGLLAPGRRRRAWLHALSVQRCSVEVVP